VVANEWESINAPCADPHGESEGIGVQNRVAQRVRIRTEPTVEPNRITLQVASDARVIVPMPVLVQPRLRIEILARQYCDGSLP